MNIIDGEKQEHIEQRKRRNKRGENLCQSEK